MARLSSIIAATVLAGAVAVASSTAALAAPSPAPQGTPVGDLSFSKTFEYSSGSSVAAGGTVDLRFRISNGNPVNPATITLFTDNLANAISGLSATAPSFDSCGGTLSGTDFLTYLGGSVAPTSSCDIVVPLGVPSTAPNGIFTNTTSDLFGTIGGLAVSAPAASDDIVVESIDFSKAFAPDSIGAGGTSTLTLTVDNLATGAASVLAVTDNLPAGMTVADPPNAATTCTGGSLTAVAGGGTVSYSGGTVAASSTCTISVDVTAASVGGLVNVTGDLTSSYGNSGTATDTLTVTATADVSITKTDGVTTATPGSSVTYTIVASNDGPSDDPAVSLDDTFPASLTCTYTSVTAGGATGNTAAGSGDLAETLSMPSGSSATYTVDCTIDPDATGTLSNTATVTASITDPDTGNDSATDADILVPEADVSITKTDGVDTAVPGGDALVYTIVAANAGPSSNPQVSVSDAFPADLTCSWTSVAAGGATGNTAAGAGDIDDALSMPPGSSATYTASCDIDAGATGTISNTAVVDGVGTNGVALLEAADPDAGNNSATDDTTLTPQADLSITKDDGVTAATVGDTLTYTIVAANAGPSDDPSATVADTFPTGLTCTYTSVAAGGASGNTVAGSGDINESLTMPAGSSVTYTASCTVGAGALGTVTNTATIAASVTDLDTTNNSATDGNTNVGAGGVLPPTGTGTWMALSMALLALAGGVALLTLAGHRRRSTT